MSLLINTWLLAKWVIKAMQKNVMIGQEGLVQ